MPDVFFPRIIQTQLLSYDAINITGVQNAKFYFSGGTIRVFFSNNGSLTADDGTYEEYTGTIASGVPFTFTFTTTGQYLRMRVVLDSGAKLYAPKISESEQDYLWQGTVIRGS